jgi:purine-nucleoside phosphorylase
MAMTGQQLEEARAFVAQHTSERPTVGVVLGSGLGAFVDALDGVVRIPYADIPHMPVAKVAGHAGNLCLGSSDGIAIACLQGRVHLYEGYSPERVVFGARLLGALGCRAVLLTNAAGGIRPRFVPGDLMLITDHINMAGQNPLVGVNDEAGPRFPDLSHAYDIELCEAARTAAKELGIELREGVYAAMLGPSYETPAEVRMLGAIGADAVGMSTVPEVIALRHRGVRVGGISCITNLAAGIAKTTLDHSEVEQTARQSREAFVRLLARWIELADEAVQS